MNRTDQACLEVLDRFNYDELLVIVVFLIRHIAKAKELSPFEVSKRIIRQIEIHEMRRKLR